MDKKAKDAIDAYRRAEISRYELIRRLSKLGMAEAAVRNAARLRLGDAWVSNNEPDGATS